MNDAKRSGKRDGDEVAGFLAHYVFGYLAKSSFRKRREEAGFEWVQDKMSDEQMKQGLS